MIRYHYIILFLFALGLQSCIETLAPKDYAQWIKAEENGWHKTKTIGDYTIAIQNKPWQYMALNEKRGKLENAEVLNKVGEKYKGADNYALTLKVAQGDFLKSGIQSEQDYQKKLYYFAYEFQDDIKLEVNDSLYDCTLYHYQRSYDLSKERQIELAFDAPIAIAKEKTLIIDSPYLQSGKLKIAFNPESLPELKLQK